MRKICNYHPASCPSYDAFYLVRHRWERRCKNVIESQNLQTWRSETAFNSRVCGRPILAGESGRAESKTINASALTHHAPKMLDYKPGVSFGGFLPSRVQWHMDKPILSAGKPSDCSPLAASRSSDSFATCFLSGEDCAKLLLSERDVLFFLMLVTVCCHLPSTTHSRMSRHC